MKKIYQSSLFIILLVQTIQAQELTRRPEDFVAQNPEQNRILMICDNFQSAETNSLGGTQKVLSIISKRLEKAGLTVGFMDIPVSKISIPFCNGKKLTLPWSVKSKIKEKIDSFKPHFIMITLLGVMSYQASAFCEDNKLPFTAFHSSRLADLIYQRSGIPTFITSYFEKKYLNRAETVLVPAQTFANELKEQGIKNPKAWPHGVNLERFAIPTPEEKEQARVACGLEHRQRPFLLNVSRLSKEKNIEEFAELDLPGTKILVGPEDWGYKIEDLQKKYPDVVFAGPQRGQDLVNFYRASDLFVFTSKTDTFGLVLLEALACGLPIVGFNTTGPGDVVPKNCGVSYLAELGERLEGPVIEALEDIKSGKITPEQCRAYAQENYSWDTSVDRLLENLIPLPEIKSVCYDAQDFMDFYYELKHSLKLLDQSKKRGAHAHQSNKARYQRRALPHTH